ncbi:unnamed protein product [Haemonchus placei]|uniref:Shugoshin_C domain-containing protein n=1 Tax=Haemonchus placei TaxID=6290 RepID=A0A0N4X2C5_HAEPC|nr:unnamed protein product [Haemonchus placei]
MEAKLISMAEERERLISSIQADEAEKLTLKESIESQLKINKEIQREADALNKKLRAKEVLIVKLEAKLAAANDTVCFVYSFCQVRPRRTAALKIKSYAEPQLKGKLWRPSKNN